MYILAKYAVTLRVVGMNCTWWWSALGASENHGVQTFKKYIQITLLHSTLRSYTLIVSNCCCHDRSILEPAAIKIIQLRAGLFQFYKFQFYTKFQNTNTNFFVFFKRKNDTKLSKLCNINIWVNSHFNVSFSTFLRLMSLTCLQA